MSAILMLSMVDYQKDHTLDVTLGSSEFVQIQMPRGTPTQIVAHTSDDPNEASNPLKIVGGDVQNVHLDIKRYA